MTDPNKDLQEEFEFRPITEGLGFHNKKQKMKLIESTLGEINPDQARSNRKSTLARPIISAPMTTTSPLKENISDSPADELLSELKNKRKTLDFIEKPMKPSFPKVSAITLDSLLVVALSLFTLIIGTLLNQWDLRSFWTAMSLKEAFINLYLFLSIMTVIYLTSFRLFIRRTPGEWSEDQLIEVKSNNKLAPIFLLTRAVLVPLTGFIFLTILSLSNRFDLLGKLTGTTLVDDRY